MANYDLKSSMRQLKTMEHRCKTDRALQQIITENALKAQATTNIAELESLVGESEACTYILNERASRRNSIEQAKESWVTLLPDMLRASILNLKTAITPNGQLVAAILEDEKALSEDEIHGWCDELGILSDSELHQLLQDLLNEGVLKQNKDRRYSLYQLCTPSLFPDDAYEFALPLMEGGSQNRADWVWIIDSIEREDGPVAPEDLLPDYQRHYAFDPSDFNYDSFISSITNTLESLCYMRVLKKYRIGEAGVDLYYYPMLGYTGGKQI